MALIERANVAESTIRDVGCSECSDEQAEVAKTFDVARFASPSRAGGRAVFKFSIYRYLRTSDITLPLGESSLSEERVNPGCQHC